jgi:Flp pilus assembly protein TadG
MIDPRFSRSQKGQAAVLLILTMVVLLGFTALAVDGGRLYSDRRHAQNAADAAALTGALQKANKQSDAVVLQALRASANRNGYNDQQVSGEVSGPFNDLYGKYYLVSTIITSTIDATFAQFIYGGPLQNKVKAVARVYISQPALPGFAIITMGDCTAEGGAQAELSGGGNNGAIETYQGGIFLNAPENPGNQCSIDTSTSTLSVGIAAYDGAHIASVGSVDYSGVSKVYPTPIDTGMNFGEPINDPLEDLPEPVCTANGSVAGGVYHPGRYGGPGQPSIGGGHYQPGIYCISGNVHLSGSEVIDGDGVVLYFINGGLNFTGNAGMRITAPTSSNCLGTSGDPTASCTFKGIAVFLARNNASTFEVRGNGGDAIHGLIYGIRATVQARGGGVDPDDTSVVGQIIARRVYGDGNGSFIVIFNENETFIKEPSLSLEK